MAIDRRSFLKASAAQGALLGVGVSAGVGVSGCATSHPGAAPVRHGANPFVHGVASGDPLADRVILWTRVSPDELRPGEPISVDWWIARDADGLDRVNGGRAEALAERDFTIKIDAEGLDAGRDYFYRFSTRSGASPVGRTRTLPRPETKVEHLRFAVASCSNYPQGFFNAYAAIALRDDLDVVLHLGDYIYEYGNGEYGDGTALDRIPDPVHEILSLEDYRRRHAIYKADPDLQAAHARHPWITVWDDHESADNSFRDGALNHNPILFEGRWTSRRLAAIRAYYEWMPIRELPTGLFREFHFGDLADLVMLDTRLAARDAQVANGDHEAAGDPSRSLLGTEQESLFLDALSSAEGRGAAWKIVGQQVIVSPLTDGEGFFNADTWDGYRESRRRVLDHIARESIEGVVFLTGDYHSSWAFEVPPPLGSAEPYDPETGAGSRAVEFVAPAVSSPPLGRSPRAREAFADARSRLSHLKFLDLEQQGYVVLDLTADRVRAEWMYTGDSAVRSNKESCGAIQESIRGTNRLQRVEENVCVS
jgi:alkaline phosphatase D